MQIVWRWQSEELRRVFVWIQGSEHESTVVEPEYLSIFSRFGARFGIKVNQAKDDPVKYNLLKESHPRLQGNKVEN